MEFNTRINYLALEYLQNVDTIIETIFQVFPYNILFIFMMFIVLTIPFILFKYFTIHRGAFNHSFSIKQVLFILVISIIAIRGGLQNEPLNWGDASISKHSFINHTGMNPIWNIGYSYFNSDPVRENKKFQEIDIELPNATDLIRNKIIGNSFDKFHYDYPLLRHSVQDEKNPQPNVVLIILESFKSSYLGVMGNKKNLTPKFDSLSKEGVLFTRMFSSGTRTNRALSSILLSFPALPRFKSILNDHQVHQSFSSLASLLKSNGYETQFLYAGDTEYDNIQSFFSQQGFNKVKGKEIYPDNAFFTKYGVADETVYEAAKGIINEATQPLFLTLLTVSNHQPFLFPENEDVFHIHNNSDLSEKEKTFQYSDWALGEFFSWFKNRDDFKNTLFIITGDHGFFEDNSNKDLFIDLDLYHIPCLIIASDLIPSVNNKIASHLDIIPTILPLIGGKFIHHSWGKNLLQDYNTEYFAVISPSGINHLSGIITDTHFLIYDFQSTNTLYKFPDIKLSLDMVPDSQNKIKQLELEALIGSFLKLSAHSLNSFKSGIPQLP
jgi:phosphoglycerol transferase MdoB-like AlkP superfamily enzyme